jgi:hypothetical protein
MQVIDAMEQAIRASGQTRTGVYAEGPAIKIINTFHNLNQRVPKIIIANFVVNTCFDNSS